MKLNVLTSVSALLLSSLFAHADVYKIGGFTFDEANSVNKAAIVEGPIVLRDFSSGAFARYSDDYAHRPAERVNLYRNFDHEKSVGKLLGRTGRSGVSRHITLPQAGDTLPGANMHRSTVELTWGDYALPNKAGADFVVYEAGNFEAFSVAVRKAGSNEFSAYRYQFANQAEKLHSINAVGFDLSDFGVGEGETIAAIRIRNIFTGKSRAGADRVDNESGQGKVVYPSDPNYQNAFPIKTKAGGKEISPEQLGADIVYVVGLHDIVPMRNNGVQASK